VLGAHEAKHPAPKQQGLLKAADRCVAAPERAARDWSMAGLLNDTIMHLRRCLTSRTAAGASTTPRTRCGSRLCALHEAGMIKSSPNKLIAESADWRFLNELKRELKA
jgi:NitT/TauT family transport system substrate-binding protein